MAASLDAINTAPLDQAAQLLAGIYEHSPWVAEAALTQRPFHTVAQLLQALAQAVARATPKAQLALIAAHPELGERALHNASLTAESAREQHQAGLASSTPQALLEQLRELNAAYRQAFGFPFVLAVRGPRGTGLSPQAIVAALRRRLSNDRTSEHTEALRQIHRIAQLRLNERLGLEPTRGHWVWDALQTLAAHSEPDAAARGELTVTYLSAAHQACARDIARHMADAGCDHVAIDAVGNVVGRYAAAAATTPARTLLTGSHYDTVHNAGRYDGRLGIFVPLAAVRDLVRQGQRLPFHLEVVAFAEEEGQRYGTAFLGSSALVGDFDPAWLARVDAHGVSMQQAMHEAGLQPQQIASLKRNPADYLGFVEVHIEQGPVLQAAHLPLGVVSAINGSLRWQCEIRGLASHAGTTPMDQRRDAVLAMAELALYAERRAAADGDSVATVGVVETPAGSINVVPGHCRFTLDLRAPADAQRDALAADIRAQLAAICARRRVAFSVDERLRAAAAPCAARMREAWEAAVHALGLPVQVLPSGAGHDAMKLHAVMPQAMLLVRGQNNGISHNPLEETTSDDIELAVQAFLNLLTQLSGVVS